MRVPGSPAPLVLALAALAACAREEAATVEAAARAGAGSEAAPPAVGSSGSSQREELRRAALRGIRYDADRARIVPEEAALLVSGPDREAAARALEEGRALFARNALIAAFAAHTRAVMLAPGEAGGWAALGDVLMAGRRGEQALAAYRSGLALAPDSAALHAGAGRALISVGRRAEGVAELRAAVRIDPARSTAFERLAIQLYYLEDDAAAWEAVHGAEGLGGALPPQFRALLAMRTPEPER